MLLIERANFKETLCLHTQIKECLGQGLLVVCQKRHVRWCGHVPGNILVHIKVTHIQKYTKSLI